MARIQGKEEVDVERYGNEENSTKFEASNFNSTKPTIYRRHNLYSICDEGMVSTEMDDAASFESNTYSENFSRSFCSACFGCEGSEGFEENLYWED